MSAAIGWVGWAELNKKPQANSFQIQGYPPIGDRPCLPVSPMGWVGVARRFEVSDPWNELSYE